MVRKEAKGTPETFNGGQRDKIYTYKLPINLPSGHCVSFPLNKRTQTFVFASHCVFLHIIC